MLLLLSAKKMGRLLPFLVGFPLERLCLSIWRGVIAHPQSINRRAPRTERPGRSQLNYITSVVPESLWIHRMVIPSPHTPRRLGCG